MKKKIKRLSVKQKNEAFLKLPPAKKRVQIAKDVIAQLNSEYLKALSGNCYVASSNINEDFNSNKEFKSVFNEADDCTVCGIGSLFVCAVKRMDKLKISEVSIDNIGPAVIHAYLEDFFSLDQLVEIEAAFEENGDYFEFIRGYHHGDFDKLKLTLIMENIIKHKGVFKTGEKYKPVMKAVLP